MYGIKDFTAVINPPHATILAVGAELIGAFKTLIESPVMMVV
jgi:pyruvate dehydrogenase E2 component (dihydrolipoamide acetyltransferase)